MINSSDDFNIDLEVEDFTLFETRDSEWTNVGSFIDFKEIFGNKLAEVLEKRPILNSLIDQYLTDSIGQKPSLNSSFVCARLDELVKRLNLYKWDELDPKSIEKILIQILQELGGEDLGRILLQEEAKKIEEFLLPGDILFEYPLEPGKMSQRIIQFGQYVFSNETKDLMKASINSVVHVALYVGEGKIAESTPMPEGDHVRIVSIQDPSVSLKPNEKVFYQIFRPLNYEIAEKAATAAKKSILETRKGNNPIIKTPNQYSAYMASKSIQSATFDDKAKRRFLKAIAFHYFDLPLEKKTKPRDFFCSYLIGWLFQAAEVNEIVKNIPLIYPKKVQDIKEQKKIISKWAKENTEKYGDLLNLHVQFPLNTKFLSPAKFRAFMKTSGQFRPVARLIP